MKPLEIIIRRTWQDKNQSTGTLSVIDSDCKVLFACSCIERGWRDNQKNVSCVPSGVYTVVFEPSNRFKMNLWELKNVPNREECKIHSANHWHQLNGCIAPGKKLIDFDKDGYLDVTDSYNTLMELHEVLKNVTETTIEIINDHDIN